MSIAISFRYDAFISYSHEDSDWVIEKLLPQLERAHLAVCIDFRDFEPGAPNLTEIERAVVESRKTLVVLTPAYLASQWAELESLVTQTLDPAARSRRLIPLLLKPCDLPVRIRGLAYLDFTRANEQDQQFERLVQVLTSPISTRITNLEEAADETRTDDKIINASMLDNLPIKLYREFVGRVPQLTEALTALHDPVSHWIVAIDGLGGIGKTALAREIAGQVLAEHLFDIVIWNSAKEEELVGETIRAHPESTFTFETMLDAIARQLGYLDILKLKDQEKQERIRTILKQRPILLVLDNLDTAREHQDSIAQNLFQLLNPSKAILTSRHKFKADVYAISLSGLVQPDASLFVKQEAHEKRVERVLRATEEQIHEIARTTGGAPLALKLIVGQLAYLEMSAVLKHLRQAKSAGPDYQFYKFIYLPSWRLLSEYAKKLLISMSHFASIGGTRESILIVSGLSDDEFASAMNELWTTSLVETGGNLEGVRYFLHPLTQYFVLADIVKLWK